MPAPDFSNSQLVTPSQDGDTTVKTAAPNWDAATLVSPPAQPEDPPSFIGRVVRSITRATPLNQMRTMDYLKKNNLLEAEPGEDEPAHAKRVQQALQQREETIERGPLSQPEMLGDPMMIAAGIGLVTKPVQTAVAIGAFSLKDRIFDARKFIEDRWPNTWPDVKDLAEVADFVASGAAIGAGMNAGKSFFSGRTADLKLPQSVNITPDHVQAIEAHEGITNTQKDDFFNTLGITNQNKEKALTQGAILNVPAERFVDLVKKPYWPQVKTNLFENQEPTLAKLNYQNSFIGKIDTLTQNAGYMTRDVFNQGSKAMSNIFNSYAAVLRRFPSSAYSDVIKSIHLPDKALLGFDNEKSKIYDKTFKKLGEWFNGFSEEDKTNLMLTRGKASSVEAQAVQEGAIKSLPDEFKDTNLLRAMTEMSDYVYHFALDNGLDMNYFEDYFRGSYKDSKDAKVANFLEYWKSTDAFMKEKTFPTPADAKAFGLQLKDTNPFENIRSEMRLVAQRVGLEKLKDSFMEPYVKKAAIVLNGHTYLGDTHIQALERAGQAGEDIKDINPHENGMFLISNGDIIPRAEGESKYGVESSSEIPSQEPAMKRSMNPIENMINDKINSSGRLKQILLYHDPNLSDKSFESLMTDKNLLGDRKKLEGKIYQLLKTDKVPRGMSSLTQQEQIELKGELELKSKQMAEFIEEHLQQKGEVYQKGELQGLPRTFNREDLKNEAQRVSVTETPIKEPGSVVNYAILKKDATIPQLSKWEEIDDPVFKDMLFDPDYAKFVNNLLSTNKISENPLLQTLRAGARLAQAGKFFGSVFHMKNETKAILSDEMGGMFNKKGYQNLIRSYKSIDENDPQYKDYVGLGGGHAYSAEVDAEKTLNNFLTTLSQGKIKFGPIKEAYAKTKWIPASPEMIKWMFEKYIPALKYYKFDQEVSEQSNKLGRPLTDAEKIGIIRTNQNFYGEMNERLLGRSGTVTSALRIVFSAPGYGEGNFRALYGSVDELKAILNKNVPQKGYRNIQFIASSMTTALIFATLGTRIMTGKWPDPPKDGEDVRDLFKTKSNYLDGNGDPVYWDMMDYANDFYSIYGNLATGQAEKIIPTLSSRVTGAQSQVFKTLVDLSNVLAGKPVYDYKGDPIFLRTDPFTTQLGKFISYEGGQAESISLGTYQQEREKSVPPLMSAVSAVAGLRTTTSEKVKTLKQARLDIFSLENAKKITQFDMNKLYVENPDLAKQKIDEFNRQQLGKLRDIAGRVGANQFDLGEIRSRFLITSVKGKMLATGTESAVKSLFGKYKASKREKLQSNIDIKSLLEKQTNEESPEQT